MSYDMIKLPPQQLPMSKKGISWRKKHLDWAVSKTYFNYSPVRKSTIHKKINYDLVNGKLHMRDLEVIVNPEHIHEKFTSTSIQHFPIINSKLNVLRGEESKRVFDYKVIITNPLALSEKEDTKKQLVLQQLKSLVENYAGDPNTDEYQQQTKKMADYFSYEWQDMREVRANELLNHYIKEYNIPLMFNEGFVDAMTVGEEIYQCDIRGGEPVVERVNPLKIRVFKSGYSNKIEDADIIILEDYWSPSKIIDAYYDVLSKEDIEYIEKAPSITGDGVESSIPDDRLGFVSKNMVSESFEDDFYFDPFGLFDDASNDLAPFDTHGNIRVVRMYWKSRRRIKKVKSYDQITGEEEFAFYPETYTINKDMGEEEFIYYINEAWEGTKIGDEIYVNMRPRVVQYNRLSNPSRCHFGIIGSIYNFNDNKPFSMVDMMKPYNYLYDVIHDRLNKLISKNWGKLVQIDLAKVPEGWEFDKWLYFARHNSIAVTNSYNEGKYGAATGKLAGALNNNTTGVIDAELGNSIQQHINLLEFIKMEMSEVAGISKQREGQISNRETVGGVERATLQSSHITEWLFTIHDDVKKRVLECLLETAKIALKGRQEKFSYILSDGSMKLAEIDGDEFAEADYGLIVDNSNGTQELSQKLDMLAQAALQNQTLSFSTIMKLYSSVSIAEKQKLVERDEQELQERQQQMQEQQLQAQQEQAQMQLQQKQAEMELREQANIRDNETKILVAQINSQAEMAMLQLKNDVEDDGIQEEEYSQEAKDKLAESIRQFDARLALDRERLKLDKEKARTDAELKRQQINKQIKQSKDKKKK